MSEINNEEIKFNIKNRKFSIKKADFKENKKEQFLFDYLTNNSSNKTTKSDDKIVSINMLDKEEGSQGTITQSDINIFLQDEKVKKKDITQQDLVKFIDKMFKLNPTELEKAQNNLNSKYKNEAGKTIMTPEIKETFGLEYQDISKEIADNDGKIKKGMEIFDLNEDGKIDEVEKTYQEKAGVGKFSKIDDFEKYLQNLDKDSSKDGNPTGIINKEGKHIVYEKTKAEITKQKIEELEKLDIKDENNNNVITDEVKNLFKTNARVEFKDITDENGNIKKGYEIFDLNADGKVDDKEKGYFSSAGHSSQTHNENVDLSEFLKAIKELDMVGYDKNVGNNTENKTVTSQDKKAIHKLLESGVYMLDNMKSLPTELQNDFAKVLKEQCLYDNKRKYAVGTHTGNIITVDDAISKPEIASVMAHELTHALLDNKMSPLQQEVVTFFMEYKLYSEAKKNDADYFNQIDAPSKNGFKTIVIDKKYMNFIDNMKKEHPEMSEKDIAVEAFLKYKFEYYNGHYQEKVSEDYMRNLDYSAADKFFKSV